MSPRKHVRPYGGAISKITPEKLAKQGPAFMIQPKMDGAYCHLHLNDMGCIQRITSKTGREFSESDTEGLRGQFVGYPGAVLIGELMAHTTAGNRDAKEFGARRVHLFDCANGLNGVSLIRETYSERRATLFRMQALIDAYGPGQSWKQTACVAQDKRTAKFCRKTYRGIALTPIVPQVRAHLASELWDRVKAGELEGLVSVSQGAPLGRRNAKLKCKIDDTVDVLVLEHSTRLITYWYNGQHCTVTRGKSQAQKGDMVALKYNGFYPTGQPRFARIDRIRHDLMVDSV